MYICSFINYRMVSCLVIGTALLCSCSHSNKVEKESEQVDPIILQPVGSYTDTKGHTWHRDNFDAPHSIDDEIKMAKEQKSRESYYDPYEEAEDKAYKKGYDDGYYEGSRK